MYEKQNFTDGSVLAAEQLNRMETGIAEAHDALPKKLTRPATAQVGDYLRIKAIGEDGTMEVEAVAAPTGGGSGSGENLSGADVTSIKTVLGNLMTIIKAQVEDSDGTPQGYNMDVSGLVAQNDALIAALGGSGGDTDKTLTSISATYSGGSVPVGTAATALTGIVVTAHYSDGSTATVTGYTLSGSIAEGTNTITVAYQGKTATITVPGVTESIPDDEDAVVYNVFSGEYENSGYSGTLQETFGSNMNVYAERVDISNADRVYWRIAKTAKVGGGGMDTGVLAIYSASDNLLGTLNISSGVTTEHEYTAVEPGVGYAPIETLDDGTVIYVKAVGSVSVNEYTERSYALFATKPASIANFAAQWAGTAQSTSALNLEGWV